MKDLRTGIGYDSHCLVTGKPLILGGVEIPYHKGLSGHSDADALLHAITDALLGASSLGDIGCLFPPSDDSFKDAASSIFLTQVCSKVRSLDWKIINVDTVVIAEEPKLNPFRDKITSSLAELLFIEPDRVGFKATTNEKMGSIGRGEGIACLATVLLAK